MKIVIIGSALSGNKGAAAMLESSLQTLSELHKDTEFTLLSLYPVEDEAQNRYGHLSILKATPFFLALVITPLALCWKLFPFFRSGIVKISPQVKALAEADALLDQGGITFVDGRELFLLYNIASILPALFLKTPVVKCAQALGPFKGVCNRLSARLLLPKMALIVSRGAITHQHLLDLNLTNLFAGADYAFALDVADQEKRSARAIINMTFFEVNRVVGVSPSAVLNKAVTAAGKDYIALMADFIDNLAEQGKYHVALIPHSVRSHTLKHHNNDLPLCSEIFSRLKHKHKCLFVDQELGSQELRYLIGECELFVASRFHAMVSALAMKVPVLVIGWSHKYSEVLEMFELEDWSFDHGKLTFEYLSERFECLQGNQENVRNLLDSHLPDVKALSRSQADKIMAVINRAGKDY